MKISPDDYTIIAGEDTIDFKKRKIRSQRAYRGAVLPVGAYVFYVTDIEE